MAQKKSGLFPEGVGGRDEHLQVVQRGGGDAQECVGYRRWDAAAEDPFALPDLPALRRPGDVGQRGVVGETREQTQRIVTPEPQKDDAAA